MSTAKKTDTPVLDDRHIGISGPFDRISQPGCFVLNKTGDLLRVPEDALIMGSSPTMDIVSREPWLVTKISNDPYVPLRAARAAAADMDLYVNF